MKKITVTEKFHRMLTERGMSDEQAGKVIQLFKIAVNESNGIYRITWESDANGYPDPIYSILWMTLQPIALEWIEKNCPQAWFRAMFDERLGEILQNSLIEGEENRISSAIEEYNEEIQEEIQPLLDAEEGERGDAIEEMTREANGENDSE